MPFPFVYACDLLDELDRLHMRQNPLLPKDLYQRTTGKANQWLKEHKFNLNAFNTQDYAVLWILRPDKLTDRAYGIDAKRLELIIARVYELPSIEYAKLQLWQSITHKRDLGACVEFVRGAMKIPATLKKDMVTVEEIQNLLLRIASFNPQSSSTVQSLSEHSQSIDIIQSLGEIYSRLHGREAKWLTRYILKDYRAILLPDSWEMESGYLGMPNVANITLDMFSRSPPIPVILDGTRMVKGRASYKSKDRPHHGQSAILKSESGWPKRPIVRSREASPISPPLSFARGVLAPKMTTTSSHSSSAPIPMKFTVLGEASSLRSKDGPMVVHPESEISNIATLDITVCSPSASTSQPQFTRLQQMESLPSKSTKQAQTAVSSPKTKIQPSASYTEVDTSCAPLKSDGNSQTRILTGLARYSPAPASSTRPKPSHSTQSTITSTTSRSTLSNLSTNTLSRPQKSSNKLEQPLPDIVVKAGTGTCRLTSTTSCPLTRCIFLLSSDLASFPRLTKSLLPWHGSHYFVNPANLSHHSFPSHCPKSRLRYRKIILVDTFNHAATVSFLKEVQALELQRMVKTGKRKRGRDGRKWVREWLEVYDWRLLEMVGKIDRGKVYDYDVWARCFVCAI